MICFLIYQFFKWKSDRLILLLLPAPKLKEKHRRRTFLEKKRTPNVMLNIVLCLVSHGLKIFLTHDLLFTYTIKKLFVSVKWGFIFSLTATFQAFLKYPVIFYLFTSYTRNKNIHTVTEVTYFLFSKMTHLWLWAHQVRLLCSDKR